jgi:hypothetical protein
MSHAIPAPALLSDPSDVRWHFLYRTAAITALISVAIFLFQIAAFFVWPPPSTAAGHFALLQSHPFIGLVSLDFLIIVDEVLAIPLFLALYLSLRCVHESLMLIATALSATSILCFLAATPALSMLVLSQKYAAAATSVEREALLAAGQALLSSWQGTPFHIGYVLGTFGMLLVAWVMLRSQVFGKSAAYVGIVASVVGFGLYLPKVGVFISILSVVVMQVWYVMIALALFRLCSRTDEAAI